MKNFKNALAKPVAGSQPWAIWIWNLSISKPEIEKQLNALISKGFGGIAIRPGRDMYPEYMSAGFLENFGYALEIAKQNKVSIRLADDFSLVWSGCVDNIVKEGRDLQATYLTFEREIADSGDDIVIDPDCEYIAQMIKRNPKGGALLDVKQVAVPAGKTSFKWKAPNADWTLLIYKKEVVRDPSGRLLPNMFNPKAAQTYSQNTLDVIRTKFSKYMITTFAGIVTELPALRPGGNGIFWEDDVVVKYRSKYKRDLLALLPHIFLDLPCSEKTRIQVHSFIYNHMAERFALVLEAWTKRYRLSQWVLWPETGMYKPEGTVGDGFIPEAKFETLGLQNLDGSLNNYALMRVAADVNANWRRRETVTVIGRNRVMAGCSLQDLKREIDLSLLSGASRIMIDGIYFNIDQRNYYKTPFNPSWYSPDWEHMKLLCDYSTKAQELLSGMHASREIAVLCPTEFIMSDYVPGKPKAAEEGLARFQKTIGALCCYGKEFDIITEELLQTCLVRQNGDFATPDRVRKGNYQALVVPYAPCISRSLLVQLEKLAIKGTALIFIDDIPQGTHEDGASTNVTTRIRKMAAEWRENVAVVSAVDLEHALAGLKPEIMLTRESGESADVAAQVYHCYEGGGRLCLLHNLSDSSDQTVIAEMPIGKFYTAIDCATGKMTDIEPIDIEKNTARLRLCFTPLQTYIITITPTKLAVTPPTVAPQEFDPFMLQLRSYRIVFKDQWLFEPLNMNALPLANWNIRMGMSRESGQISHFYETTFEVRSNVEHCALVLNGIGNQGVPFQGQEVMFNGVRIDNDVPEENATAQMPNLLLDVIGQSVRVFDLTTRLSRGLNRISIRTTGNAIEPQTLVYPPLLTGDFAVTKGANGWALDKPFEPIVGHESWAKHGYPYLSGRARYTQTFEVPNEYDKLVLRFSKVSGTVYVKVNDTDLGMLHWHPMEFDITRLCNLQRNTLVVEVVNTMDNVMRMSGRPSGLTGEVYVDVYRA